MGDTVASPPRGYSGFYSPPDPAGGHRGGCAVYVHLGVPFAHFPLQSPLQAVAVQLHLERRFTIVSLYLPPNDPIIVGDLEELVRQLPRPFLLLGDLNGRHPMWGDTLSNSRGNLLISWIEDMELGVLNTGEPTHFHVQTGSSTAIDLSICSSDALLDYNWEVKDDLHGSDHFPIILRSARGLPCPRAPRWQLDRANWELFKNLSEMLVAVDDFPSVDVAVDYLTDTLYSAGLHAIPRTTGMRSRRPVPWWSLDLAVARKAKRAAYTRYHRHKCDHCLIEFRKARARYRRLLKDSRRESWSSFVTTINCKTPLSLVWNRIRKITGKFTPSPPPILKVGGDTIAEPSVVANMLAEAFANVSRRDADTPSAQLRRTQEARPLDFSSGGGEAYNLPFTMQEFQAALSACGDTSPGPDDIPYAMIRRLSEESQAIVLDIFNRVWQEGVLPSGWKVATVLPFPKQGKDHSIATNFRPIALTSCLCKLLEKIINVRLVWFHEKGGFISPSQCGFRRMHSTIDALFRLESSICEAFASKQHHITIFFDLEKAYDTAWRYGILKSLHDFGLRGRMARLIESFLTDRSFRVRVGNSLSDLRCQEQGVPQGSVLSVTLFAIAINGIVDVLPPGVSSTLYVDDLSISFSASRMSVAERRLQLSLDKVSRWVEERGFRFSQSKTVAMHFCRNRGVHPDPDLILNGRRIICVEETRFLGLIFDRKLTWASHLRSLKASCLRALDILRVLAHTSWGADRTTLLRLHRVLVMSKLDYGCEVYSSATPNRLKTLDAVHHSGIRLATGAFKSSPITSLLVEAGQPPLDLRRQTLITQCWYRVQRLPNSLTSACVLRETFFPRYDNRPRLPKPYGYRAHMIMSDLHLPKIPVYPVKHSTTGPWVLPEVQFCRYFAGSKANTPEWRLRIMFLEHASRHVNSIPVYTDGSKSDSGVGFGAVFPNFSRSGGLPTAASVFTAELSAILLALKEIFLLEAGSFTIYSDSRSALQALEFFNSPHPLVVKILEWLLINGRRGQRVTFCWVPAHVDVLGNEKADAVAKAAASSPTLDGHPLPFRDMRPGIRTAIFASWQSSWDAIVGPNKLREVKTTVCPFTYPRMTRWETALARLRIRHSRLTHGYLMAREPRPICGHCEVPLTVRHLLVECSNLGDLRRRYFNKYRGEDGTYQLSLILGDVSFPGGGIFKFIEEAELLSYI